MMLSYKHTVVSLLGIVLVACGTAAIVESPPAPIPVFVPEPVEQPLVDIALVEPPADSLYIYNPVGGSVLIDFEIGNESGMHLNGRDAFISIGRNVSNQDNDPRIQFFTGAREPGDYTRGDDWDFALTGVGHSFDGKANGHLRLNGQTFMIRGPPTRYTTTIGASGGGNGGRYLVFQTCDDPSCSDDTDRSSYIGHLETGGLIFGTVQAKYEPGTATTISHSVMRLSPAGLFPTASTGALADNRGSLGSALYRWASIHAVDVQAGDIRFENGLAWTESNYLGVDLPPGIGLVNDRESPSTLLLFISADGTVYTGPVQSLDDLRGIQVAPPETRLRRSEGA